MITSGAQKITHKETLTEAITGAALAFAKVISPSSQNQQSTVQVAPKTAVQSGVSPMSKARLNITQLKSLQELRDCGVLSDEEFLEQKSFALQTIRSTNIRK